MEALVDCAGVQGLYTYRVPPTLTIAVGDILSVPFGSQQVGAISIRLLATPPQDLAEKQIRAVVAVISRGLFSVAYWQLMTQIAEYYQTPLIQVIRTALPPGLLGRSQRRIRLLSVPLPPDAATFLPPVAVCVLTQLQQSANGDYTWQYLRQKCRGANRGIQALIQRGWAESYLALPAPPQPKRRQAVTVMQVPPLEDGAITRRQHEVLSLLQRQGGDLWLADALQYCRTTSATLRSLAQKGYLTIEAREVLRQPALQPLQSDQPKTLTSAQQAALKRLAAATDPGPYLLHGVTGSGKTEVYLQVIAPRLVARQSALVLVPEIGLTPQLTDRFQQRFGDRICVYHSGLSDGERYDAWRRMLQGEPLVAIGTRSAVFAPLPRLGIIILDEEHDSSFKQDQPMPCYHARTIAQWRAEREGCPLLLGSATPSLESWIALANPSTSVLASADPKPCAATENLGAEIPTTTETMAATVLTSTLATESVTALSAVADNPRYLALPERVHQRPAPPITVVDMRLELQIGNRSIFSRALRAALATMKEKNEQGILFIQRRGHSSFVSCRLCGHVMMCPHCDVSLSYHQSHSNAAPRLRCHYCGFGQTQPSACPSCGSKYLKHFGSGTQRVEQAIAQELPQLRCLRFDSDTTRAKGAHRALLARFAQGEADVLVGTQMLTKGIDLPQVTVVGIIAADGLLYMADYRASERAFQVLTQVAGRSGRGEQPGRVILQTYNPENPVVEAVKQQNLRSFIETEIQQRSTFQYPPIGRLILLRITSPQPHLVEQAARQLAVQVAAIAPNWTLLGPSPAPILRVARRYRWQILLKGKIADPVPDLSHLSKSCPSQVSLIIDVDPLNLM